MEHWKVKAPRPLLPREQAVDLVQELMPLSGPQTQRPPWAESPLVLQTGPELSPAGLSLAPLFHNPGWLSCAVEWAEGELAYTHTGFCVSCHSASHWQWSRMLSSVGQARPA